MSTASYDRASGIITLTGGDKQHSPEDIRDRVREVNDVIARARADAGHVRLLHLAHDLPVQTQETTAASTEAMQQNMLDGPGDRFAIVIDSTLSRMQFTRIAGSDNRKAFATEAEARAWLLS